MNNLPDARIRQKPREKLISDGAPSLTDQELLAVLLGSGNKSADVFTLAKRVVSVLDKTNTTFTVEDLETIPGIGSAKASMLVAALEFSKRRILPEGTKIREPQDVLPLVRHLADRRQETFICISLNGAHEVISTRIVTIGIANACQVHPREVFADAIVDRACSIVVAHNHPSGDLTPSPQDHDVTQRLKHAAEILGIKFLDHIIFSKRGCRSIYE
jgi:DNA repair protein RadC